MAESCVLDPHHARKIHAMLLQSLSLRGQGPVAKALDVSDATISRMKTDDLERLSAFIAVLGWKLSPVTSECHTPEYLRSLRYFAKIGMNVTNGEDVPSTLEWADE